MIDETLYQLATDELNSDQRKPDIWARACALASNDHDEARYLYTNLRVEQMLAEQANKDKALARSGGLPAADLTLELHDETQLDETSPIESTRTGQTSDFNLKADGLELEGDSGHSSVIGHGSGLELSMEDFDLDPQEIASMNASEPGTTSSIHGKVTKSDLSAASDRNAISMEDDPLAYWAQQHQEQIRLGGENDNDDAARSKELARQADELPGLNSDIVAVESTAPSSPEKIKPSFHLSLPEQQQQIDQQKHKQQPEAYAEPMLLDELQQEPQQEPPIPAQRAPIPAEAPVHFDYADGDDNIANDVINTPTTRTASGKRYYVYSRGDKSQAVKDGVSWPAMFLTLPWLLTKGMLGTGIVYTMLWLILIAGLLTTGFAWMDAAPNASTAIKIWTGLFVLLALIGLFYVPFRHGNAWFQQKLQRRGYELDALVHAKNRKEAINTSLDSATF